MTDDTYTVFTPYGIVRATFPEDAGIAMEGHEDAIAAVRRAILASIDERGMTTTPEALDPDRFVQWCQGPDSSITIVPPAMDGMEPEPPPHPEEADMQQADTITLDGVEELPGMRAAIAAAANPLERIALVKAMKAAQAAWAAEEADTGLTPDEYAAVARTIMQQLGGNKFKVMTGAKHFTAMTRANDAPNGGLAFAIPSGLSQVNGKSTGINGVKVRLNASDTYDIEFTSSRGKSYTVKATATDIYADMLQEVFTRYTGLDTSLGSAGPAVDNRSAIDQWGQELADIMRDRGLAAARVRFEQIVKDKRLTVGEVAALKSAMEKAAGPELMEREGTKAGPKLYGMRAYTQGKDRAAPDFLTPEQAAQWIAGYDENAALDAPEGLTTELRRRTEEALKETEAMLAKQLAYSADMQKPMMIEWYRAHADYLRAVLAGTAKIGEGPKPTAAQQADWDTTALVLAERARQSEEWAPFVHKGLKVFPTNMRAADGSVSRRWQVQTPENAEREQRGERQIGGDALASTREGAIERAEEMLREVERRKGWEDEEAKKAEADKKFAEEATARRAAAGLLEFVKGMSPPTAARALKTLEKPISVRGKFKPTYEHMRDLVLTEGYRVNQDDTRLATAEGSFFTSADFPVTAFNYAKFLAQGVAAPAEDPQGPYPYRYALVNRPADLGTIPKGVKYTVIPRPAAGQPHADMARHGILTTERELTAEEIKAFELAPLVDGDDLGALANAIAEGMGKYAAGYLEMAKDDPEHFGGQVREALKRASSGITYSVGDDGLLVQMVRDKLAAMVPADPKPDNQMALDVKFLTEVSDGKHPAMLEPELADDIEAAINRHPGDADLQALGERAIIAYSNSLMAATKGAA